MTSRWLDERPRIERRSLRLRPRTAVDSETAFRLLLKSVLDDAVRDDWLTTGVIHVASSTEHAPYAYKSIEPVIDSVADAGIARRVARLLPLCTVKG